MLTPEEWLDEHIDTLDEARVRNLLDTLREYLSDDDVLEACGEQMEADGYFEGREEEYEGYQMIYAQAVKVFKQTVRPYVIARYGEGDVIAEREEWNNWTDMLCRDGVITDWQYENWDNPF